MPYPNYTPESATARGEEIYQQQIRHKVEPEHKGKFLVLDIETGDKELSFVLFGMKIHKIVQILA